MSVRAAWTLLLGCAAAVAVAGAAGCGSGDDDGPGSASAPAASTTTAPAATNPTPRPRSGTIPVAALGDSITAGTPLWDPNAEVRAQIGAALDEQSQWEYWYERAHPRYEIRNCGINGQRTDEIRERLRACADGARVLVVQGGINDIAQGRSVEDAAQDLREMYQEGKALGLEVVGVELLPWNNGYPDAAPKVLELNRLIHAAGRAEGVPIQPWYSALEDPQRPGRMALDLTIEGNHPSVAGYRRLAAVTTLPGG